MSSTSINLVDLLVAIHRLEGALHSQDKRLDLIEHFVVRSGASSPITSDSPITTAGTLSSIASAKYHSQPQHHISTTDCTPASVYRASLDSLRLKFAFPESDASSEPGDSGGDYIADARSVSVYSRHPSRLLLVDLDAANVVPDLPLRSPLRDQDAPPPDRYEGAVPVGHEDRSDAGVAVHGLAYGDVVAGPEPSRVRPAEVYHGEMPFEIEKSKTSRVHGVWGRGRKVWMRTVSGCRAMTKLQFQDRWDTLRRSRSGVGNVRLRNKGQKQRSMGIGGLWWTLVLLFTERTHRARPYVVA